MNKWENSISMHVLLSNRGLKQEHAFDGFKLLCRLARSTTHVGSISILPNEEIFASSCSNVEPFVSIQKNLQKELKNSFVVSTRGNVSLKHEDAGGLKLLLV